MKTYFSLLTLVVAVGAALVARDGYATQEGSGASNSSAEVTSPQMATDMASAPAAAATPAAEPTVDANGVALPGHEVISPELQAVRDAEKCVKVTRRADGTVEKSESVKCVGVDYTQKNPEGSDAKEDTAMGADARDQAAYNPPKNLDINGQKMSWAKYESFKQIGESKGYSQEAIQGIAARLQVESGGTAFGFKSIGATGVGDLNRGGSFGVEQWNGKRADDMVGYINDQRDARDAANGTNSANATKSGSGLKNSAFDQYNYVYDELEQKPSMATGGTATVNQLKNSTDASAAAQLWTSHVERPANAAGQAYGLAGGNVTAANAAGFASLGNNDPVANTSGWNSNSYTKFSGSGSSVTAGSGGGTGTGMIGGSSGSSLGSTVGSAIGSIFGGSSNSGLGSSIQQILNNSTANGGQLNASQIVAALVAQKLMGQSDAEKAAAAAMSSTKNGTSTSTSTSSSSSGSAPITVTQAVVDLASQCGRDVPHTKDALMLMIKECQM